MSLRSKLEKKTGDKVLEDVDNSVTVESASDSESSEEEDKKKKSEHKGCCGDDGNIRPAKKKDGYNWAALSILILFVGIPVLTGFQYAMDFAYPEAGKRVIIDLMHAFLCGWV